MVIVHFLFTLIKHAEEKEVCILSVSAVLPEKSSRQLLHEIAGSRGDLLLF